MRTGAESWIASPARERSPSLVPAPARPKCSASKSAARACARRNKMPARNQLWVGFIEGDVFQFLRGAEKSREHFDLIILDPPSFTKTKSGLHDALRGYKELHVRAFNLLASGGLLATFSCSHHVSAEIFEKMIADALVDARRSARRLRRFAQALDHPILPTIPETHD